MKRFWQKEKGFTLIELLIVVAIIGIVAGIAIPRFLGARTVAKVTRAFADMRTIADGLEMYFTAENKYPLTLTDADLATYLTSIPKDPFGTDDVPNIRYYCNGDEDAPATMWLIVSNGPDLSADVTIAADAWAGEDFTTVAGELGGPNGVYPTEEGETYYGVGADDGGWSLAKSATDKGDIGRGGP